jgi:hypothetical protein
MKSWYFSSADDLSASHDSWSVPHEPTWPRGENGRGESNEPPKRGNGVGERAIPSLQNLPPRIRQWRMAFLGPKGRPAVVFVDRAGNTIRWAGASESPPSKGTPMPTRLGKLLRSMGRNLAQDKRSCSERIAALKRFAGDN